MNLSTSEATKVASGRTMVGMKASPPFLASFLSFFSSNFHFSSILSCVLLSSCSDDMGSEGQGPQPLDLLGFCRFPYSDLLALERTSWMFNAVACRIASPHPVRQKW